MLRAQNARLRAQLADAPSGRQGLGARRAPVHDLEALARFVCAASRELGATFAIALPCSPEHVS